MRRIVPDERAAQGRSGKRVLGVLIGALALCAIATLAFMMWAQGTSPDESQQARGLRQGTTAEQSVQPGGARTSPANPAYPAPSVPRADSPSTTGSTAAPRQ